MRGKCRLKRNPPSIHCTLFLQTAKENPMNCSKLSRSCNYLDARHTWIPPAELVLIGTEDSDRQCLHLGTTASAVWARETVNPIEALIRRSTCIRRQDLSADPPDPFH